jgi:hypothetical protein
LSLWLLLSFTLHLFFLQAKERIPEVACAFRRDDGRCIVALLSSGGGGIDCGRTHLRRAVAAAAAGGRHPRTQRLLHNPFEPHPMSVEEMLLTAPRCVLPHPPCVVRS